jgi:hypothetical protein
MLLTKVKIDRTTLRTKLADLGLSLEESGGSLDWMLWDRKGSHTRLSASAYHGIWNAHFIRLGFDSDVLRGLSFNEQKNLVDDFLALGEQIWNSFQFYEGDLSPEETGSMIYGMRDARIVQFRDDLPAHNYARFFSPEAARLTQIMVWAQEDYPLASIRLLSMGGISVIWNPSTSGLEKFLSDEFLR